jgi:hypothetical protein
VLGPDDAGRDRLPQRAAVGHGGPAAGREHQPLAAPAAEAEPLRGLAQHQHRVGVDLAVRRADQLLAPAQLVERAGDGPRRQVAGGGERQPVGDLGEQPVERAQQRAGGRRHPGVDRLAQPRLQRREQAAARGRPRAADPVVEALVEDAVVERVAAEVGRGGHEDVDRHLGLLVAPAAGAGLQLAAATEQLQPVGDQLLRLRLAGP